ncbi:MAG: MFS transporter [Candidatus Thermoplasmatota archaeon]|nr:MFS transporter [Candidatus Thermoplasmatota archaeon]
MNENKNATKYRFVVLVMDMLVYMMFMAILISFSISAPFLKEDFGLSDITLNYGYIAYTAGLVVSMWWGGKFFDRHGINKTMILASTFFLLPQFLIPYVPSWGAIVFLRFVQGNVLAMFPGLVAMNGLWFPEKEHGLASGIFMGGAPLGTAIGNYLCSVLLPLLGWKDTFIALGFIALFFVVLWFALVASKTAIKERPEKREEKKSTGAIYKNPIALLLAFIMLGNCWQIFAMYGVTQSMLFDYGYGLEAVGILGLVLGLIGVFSTPMGGITSDVMAKRMKMTRARVISMLIGFVIAFIATLLVPFLVQFGYAVALGAMVFMGFGVPWTNGPYWALPAEIFPEEQVGEGAGFAGFVGNTADIFGPFIATFLGANYGWISSMSFLAIGPLISVVACVILLRIA